MLFVSIECFWGSIWLDKIRIQGTHKQNNGGETLAKTFLVALSQLDIYHPGRNVSTMDETLAVFHPSLRTEFKSADV